MIPKRFAASLPPRKTKKSVAGSRSGERILRVLHLTLENREDTFIYFLLVTNISEEMGISPFFCCIECHCRYPLVSYWLAFEHKLPPILVIPILVTMFYNCRQRW